jgi:ribosomal protein S18 acetylase RimI-like enzyme
MNGAAYRPLSLGDAPAALVVMRAASGGLGRLPEEMDLPWIEGSILGALDGGVAIGAWIDGRLAGLVKAPRMPSVQFRHVLWDLTIATHPEFQGRGLGRGLFEKLFDAARALDPPIERVELVVRHGLAHAIRLYEQMGFVQEGRFARRFHLADGSYEDDLPMAKFL